MEPDTYGGVINSVTLPTSLILSKESIPIPIISSSNTNNYETRSSSSSRRHHRKHQTNATSADDQDERIEVKILPQDDNWGETTTTTCNGANEDALTNDNDTTLQLHSPIQNLTDKINHRKRSIVIYHFVIYLLCLIAFVSPILFLTLPYILIQSDLIAIDDYTLLLTIIFKLLLSFVGTLLLLHRRRTTIYLPRIHLHKILFTMILTMIILAYWLYYIFKLLQPNVENYEKILSMTSTYEDLLLFLLLLVVVVLETRWLYPKWIVKVVRSPDGETRQYTIGSMSIQEASVYLLEQYYKDFPVFNPWLENVHQTQARQHGAFSTKSIGSQSNASTIATGVNRNRDVTRSIHEYNDRFYDELDYERRVRKRRTKLVSSCEDAFTHVRKCLNEKYGSHIPMDVREAAQAVFSSMSRSLQKYLRITRQQPYFTRESIISHLSTCLSHDLSPRAFLERYVQTESQPLATTLLPAIASTTNHAIEQSWSIICDPQSYIYEKENRKTIPINQSICANLVFVLKQQHAKHIGLICSFHPMPRIHLIENFFDLKQNRFVLKLNSETSV
ncbi:unnamed protein product [Rotaria magnacalcarata]|uniref:Vang-like protein n=2 Tax=Rotaria magnacalcarata TaxID=392030 RepID=A0A814XN03_9BILA|nr:unnamed protein product [Rotaria magnacalcarata]CAF1437636.1 unnamed protein product [Rotaria magnacalcarata]CAF2031245.1 unnamed protein product [Rotaria magnacalcarata]